jgi:DNA/RNA-binding domain of Phe-tRNA-synthetase-like protein
MTIFPEFEMSGAYLEAYPDVGFGLALVAGCRDFPGSKDFTAYKRRQLRKMRKRETLAQISRRIGIYADFFENFGYACPLVKHLKRTVNSGFPQYSLFVDAHFMAEMCAGILVAVTDFSRFEGKLTLDTAAQGEVCAGMGGREFVLKTDEIVLRDEKDIVCVLCQGADEKTRVSENTTDVLFYTYAVPGIERQYLRDGLTLAADTVREFGGGRIEGVEIF